MIVYKATSPSNKIYIGITKFTLNRRKRGHKSLAKKSTKTAFCRAIRKYGIDNFKWEIIDTATDYDLLLKKEQFYIEQYKKCFKLYNQTLGGEGTLGYAANKGIKHSKERRKKNSETNIKLYGKKTIVINSITQEKFEFNSISEVSKNLNLPYTQVKNSRRVGSTYKGYFILHYDKYDSNKKYIKKKCHNALEFKIQNNITNEIKFCKSIKDLMLFLNIKEKRARNMFYLNKIIQNWKVLHG